MKYFNFVCISVLFLLFVHSSTYSEEPAAPNRIEPYHIYLGDLPLSDKDHGQQIADLGVTWVISLVEDSPVQPEDWQQNGMTIEHIPAVDTEPLKPEEIKRGVESLAQVLDQGHTVYIHCKEGSGHSASIVIAYLMQYQTLPYDDALALVKTWRPTITLNDDQSQAILEYFNGELSEQSHTSWASAIQDYLSAYFQNANDITEDKLAQTLDTLFYTAVGGIEASQVPFSVAEWIPQLNIESTLSRRNRYLNEFAGNQEKAAAEAIKRNQSYFRKMQLMALGLVPFVGSPASYSMNLWYQLREICLIAAIHGHDLYAPEVKIKVMSALVGSRMINAAVGKITKVVAKEILVTAGANMIPGAAIAIPLKMAFNYFTDNATKVSEHAQVLFGGEHSLLIEAGDVEGG